MKLIRSGLIKASNNDIMAVGIIKTGKRSYQIEVVPKYKHHLQNNGIHLGDLELYGEILDRRNTDRPSRAKKIYKALCEMYSQ